jgi:hypothetical protein
MGSKINHGNSSFNLPNSQVRPRGKNGMNQSLIQIQPFVPKSFQFFYLSLYNSAAKRILGRKNIEGEFATIAPPPPKLRI